MSQESSETTTEETPQAESQEEETNEEPVNTEENGEENAEETTATSEETPETDEQPESEDEPQADDSEPQDDSDVQKSQDVVAQDGSEEIQYVSKGLQRRLFDSLDTALMESSSLAYWLRSMYDGVDKAKEIVKVPEVLKHSLIKIASLLFNIANDIKKPQVMKSFVKELYDEKTPVIKMQDSVRIEAIQILEKSIAVLRKMFSAVADLPTSAHGSDFVLTDTAVNALYNIAVDYQSVAKKCSDVGDKDTTQKSLVPSEKENSVKDLKKEQIIKFLGETELSDEQMAQMRDVFSPMLESAKDMVNGTSNTEQTEEETTEEETTQTEDNSVEDQQVETEDTSDSQDVDEQSDIMKALDGIKKGQDDYLWGNSGKNPKRL
jgi:hypothetical protein